MATVNLVDVSKFYDGHLILDKITMNIEKGEFVAVVGPSGSGKSTLLRLVAGLDDISSGRILINDECVNKVPPAQRNMAMVFQNYALYPHMTVYANIAYGLKLRRMPKDLIQQRVHEVASLLQINDYLLRKPKELSGGQRQRVAMGRAMVRSPAVFLFDEPLSNLDAKLRTEMRHEIKKLHQQLKTTCLYVTHDQIEAMTLADKIVVLNQGCVEQIGTPQEVYQNPHSVFVAGFMGHYPMNFIPGRMDVHQGKIVTLMGVEMPIPFNLKGSYEEVVVGVRPEHFEHTTEKDELGFMARIEFVDDMGADKLLQLETFQGKLRLSTRLFHNVVINDKTMFLKINQRNASLFCKKSGLRIGGWDE
jgi:sn-glycerol 3-phosphate transport system ATP-binding protein